VGRPTILESGHVYGRLRVTPICVSTTHGVEWLCICECGQELFILGTSLRQYSVMSCGCLKRELNREKCAEINARRKAHAERKN
jgi:hypothetical protein